MRTTEAPDPTLDWSLSSPQEAWLPLAGSSPLLPGFESTGLPLGKGAVSPVRPSTNSKASPPESVSCEFDPDSSDDLDPAKKRARAAQARFRHKQKVRGEQASLGQCWVRRSQGLLRLTRNASETWSCR